MAINGDVTNRQVLLIGAGGVGAMACVSLERSCMASVTVVLRSNYDKVKRDGFEIESVDHGKLSSWRPTTILDAIPQTHESATYDYVVVTMKNIPEISNIPATIKPAVTPGYTTIVLIQNGIYIEQPILDAFPSNVVLSGVSYIGAHERNGCITHNEHDHMNLGVFHNQALDKKIEHDKLQDFATIYSANRAVSVDTAGDIMFYRWRKVLWNGVFNSMCAITQLDSAAIRHFGGEYSLLRPGMAEMAAIAKADGYDLGPDIVDLMIDFTPVELAFRPSMLVDVDKGNPMEIEVILGNVLRVARKRGVLTPILDNTYRFLKLIQTRLLATRGLVSQKQECASDLVWI
ncbi:Ketopantoate reductase ApbA/PanE C-terminal [Penicillium atrosanguineum]|uniref:2-dehydropantoate 2-reductase n=1 Tax=Penicillium atrosanguineum TaxID=1132637 RepID=A0A9W9H9K6_9EURO|nr:Ketopantoate reductase ApbA/PanE C-terminal [Penicillium atrosanguineum]KAJ5141026.1 Ketopantoate reductase ApbA/PanE C-terminal [Penicillium atrosanguineum]KAJ5316473.1 Ketopantoate reductase ApbA/PanE C-terminal [Penicillium atrosanguineum]